MTNPVPRNSYRRWLIYLGVGLLIVVIYVIGRAVSPDVFGGPNIGFGMVLVVGYAAIGVGLLGFLITLSNNRRDQKTQD